MNDSDHTAPSKKGAAPHPPRAVGGHDAVNPASVVGSRFSRLTFMVDCITAQGGAPASCWEPGRWCNDLLCCDSHSAPSGKLAAPPALVDTML